MQKNKKNNVSFNDVFTDKDRKLMNEPPRGIRELVNSMNEHDDIDNLEENIKERMSRSNSFIKLPELKIDNKTLEEKIAYYQRMGKNKKSVLIYIEENVKKKLDILMQSPKYKAFDKVTVVSAIISSFLDLENEEINKAMEIYVKKIEDDLKNITNA